MVAERLHPQPKHRLQSFAFSETNSEPKKRQNKYLSLSTKDATAAVNWNKALQKFNETIHFEYGRYQVPWPWKEESPSLPTNYELAIGKLRSEVNRLSRDDKHLQKNGAVIQDQVQKGIVEAVPDESHQSFIRYDIHSISVGRKNKKLSN